MTGLLTGVRTGLRKLRVEILVGFLAGTLLAGAATVDLHAQGPFSAQIQAALKVFLSQGHTWNGTKGFGTSATIGPTIEGLTFTPGQAGFDGIAGTAFNTTRVANVVNRLQITGNPSTTKYGDVSLLEIPSSNSNQYTGIMIGASIQTVAQSSAASQLVGAHRAALISMDSYGTSGIVGMTGATIQAQVHTGSGAVGTVTGAQATAEIDASATTTMYGIRNIVQTTGTGTAVTAYGTTAEVNMTTANTTTYGFYSTVTAVSGGSYGVYIASVTGAFHYAFFNADSASFSYFAGGTQSPFYSINSAPQTLPSAATINPQAMVAHISGTAAIATITVPASCINACMLYLIPDGIFTTTTGGNISLASTAVVNKALTMVWDGTKWNPSY